MTRDKSILKNQAVLITGASSGIGRATAIYLARTGMKAYAGVRKEADKKKLLKISAGNLHPVILDVCDQNTIDETYKIVEKENAGSMVSLVNNAGVSLNGPLEILPVSAMEKLIRVNLIGLMAVTRRFIPLIRQGRGRLVNISSGHGLMAIPGKSAYAASKFGVQAVTDSLRLELKPFGISVSGIVVGKVSTQVLDKILKERKGMMEHTSPEILNLYKDLIGYFDREVKNISGIEPVEVSRTIFKALTDPSPKRQYLIGPGARKMKMLSRFPSIWRDSMIYNAIYRH